jgi:hypothetical protein
VGTAHQIEPSALLECAAEQMQKDTAPTAVCIGIDADELAVDLLDALTPFRCVHYRDVYRALARMSVDQPALILVEVGWLPHVAFEFFEIIAASRPDLPVFTVGPERADSRVRDAIARGAHGRATPEGLRACAATNPNTAAPPTQHATSKPGQPAERETLLRNQSDTLASAGNVLDAELDRRLRAQADALLPAAGSGDEGREPVEGIGFGDDVAGGIDGGRSCTGGTIAPQATTIGSATEAGDVHSSEGGARVPWTPHSDRPRRVPPQRTPPLRTAPSTAKSSKPAAAPELAHPDPDPPLLSEEEIAALLGPAQGNRRE